MSQIVVTQDQDNSAVFHRDALDPEYRGGFPLPWIFQADDDTMSFATEDEACAAQRMYRIANGFNPIAGKSSSV